MGHGERAPRPRRRTRSGFIALAGRPNVGKSTLANAIVGAKVAIVSDKPQTTRRAIRGVATGKRWQLVLVDLPGVQRPRDALTARMQRRVEQRARRRRRLPARASTPSRASAPATGSSRGCCATPPVPVVIAVNKVDRADRAKTAAALAGAAELDIAEEIFPVSARTGAGLPPLVDHLVTLLPPGPFYFERRAALRPVRVDVLLAELVREQVLARTREEVPHAVEVEIEAIDAAARTSSGSRPSCSSRPSPRRGS